MNQAVPDVMEPQIPAETHDDIKEVEQCNPEDETRSSSVSSRSAESASSDFSFEDPYQLDVNEHGSFVLEHEHASDSSNNAAAPPGSTSTLETPPVQVMERPPDASGYRIPSYVFARNKSGTPNQEWSTASNESLFSIHTGNMSFTRDQFNWLLKSGELGLYNPGDIRKSGELPPPSPRIVPKSGEPKPVIDLRKSEEQMPPVPPPDPRKSGEHIIANHFKSSSTSPPTVSIPSDVEIISPPKAPEPVITQEVTVNIKKDDPKPEVKAKKKVRSCASDEVPFSASVSHHSDTSGQSFAFPVLAEIDREKSVNSGQSRAEQLKNTSNLDPEGSKSPTSAPPPAPSSASWLSSCFSCCSCC